MSISKSLQNKLKQLPETPGVYFHKNFKEEIIYVGKAAVLKNRVRQYFQASRNRDPKTEALVAEIADVEWIEVETEIDALFLEAEMVKRYLPPYNILLRDDKSSIYVRIDFNSEHPTVSYTRMPHDDRAEYLGPFYSKLPVARALKYLRKAFPYSTHVAGVPKRACLQAHIGLCPGLEEDLTTITEYRKNLKNLMKYLKGQRKIVTVELEKNMTKASKLHDFESAAKLRNQLFVLKDLQRHIVFSDKESLDISKDRALTDLSTLIGIGNLNRIEGFDISHMSGTDNVASMVVFTHGLPDKTKYKKFKLRVPGNDDFAHMYEVISRRLSEKNRKSWGVPNLILIDGGKGQLRVALRARDEAGLSIPMIGLAKRFETIIIPINTKPVGSTIEQHINKFKMQEVRLPPNSHIVKLLQRIRDESHRFAISYHSVLKSKRQTASVLDEIPGIGPVTRKKLLRTFGSISGIVQAQESMLVQTIGVQRADVLRRYIQAR